MRKLLTFGIILATIPTAVRAQNKCDTLFNLQSDLDTAYYYTVNSPQTGYISGNNSYGDLAKAEGFASLTGDSVTAAVLYFAICTINSTDSNNTVTVYAWNNSDTSFYGLPGAPGNALDSATITLSQIAEAVTQVNSSGYLQGIQVNFTHNAILTTDTFYVGVMLPTKAGDTIALYQNEGPPSTDGDAWELTSADGWGSYNYDWTWGGSVGNYIEAILCGPNTTGIITPDNNNTISIYPNPAEDILNVAYNGQTENEKYIVFDMMGNRVLAGALTNTVTSVGISSLSAGAYFVRVSNANENAQTFKFIKLK